MLAEPEVMTLNAPDFFPYLIHGAVKGPKQASEG